jgi:hypothetical protein
MKYYSILIELRKLVLGSMTELNNGDIKKKKKRLREGGEQSGLRKGTYC